MYSDNVCVTNELNALKIIKNANSSEKLRSSLLFHYPSLNKKFLKKIIIIGAADEGRRLIKICKEIGIAILAVADDQLNRQKVNDIDIVETDCLANFDYDVPVIIASHRILHAKLKLTDFGFKTIVPFAALQVLYPDIFKPHMFYNNWFESLIKGCEKLIQLSNLLTDGKSLDVLEAILSYRLTFDPCKLEPIIDWDMYGFENFIYGNDEVYIDGGTFDGDTVYSFIKRVHNKFEIIYAFEPDTNTYRNLKLNFINDSRVVPINKGLYLHSTTLHFDNAGTRASIFDSESQNGLELPVTSIDEVLDGKRVSLIKMNIEGAEIPALNGASNSISKYKPKLAISVYHHPTDLWEIPLLVRNLNPGYSLYLRQHDGGTIESVMYAC